MDVEYESEKISYEHHNNDKSVKNRGFILKLEKHKC